MTENEIGEIVLGAAMKVHSALGPGLLENAYEFCLVHELRKQGFDVQQQMAFPIEYDGDRIDAGYRLDVLVAGKVVLEIKTVEHLAPVHTAQLLSYLKLGGFKLGYLLNFHVAHMRQGTKRLVNGL